MTLPTRDRLPARRPRDQPRRSRPRARRRGRGRPRGHDRGRGGGRPVRRRQDGRRRPGARRHRDARVPRGPQPGRGNRGGQLPGSRVRRRVDRDVPAARPRRRGSPARGHARRELRRDQPRPGDREPSGRDDPGVQPGRVRDAVRRRCGVVRALRRAADRARRGPERAEGARGLGEHHGVRAGRPRYATPRRNGHQPRPGDRRLQPDHVGVPGLGNGPGRRQPQHRRVRVCREHVGDRRCAAVDLRLVRDWRRTRAVAVTGLVFGASWLVVLAAGETSSRTLAAAGARSPAWRCSASERRSSRRACPGS